MAEILVKAVDATHPDPTVDRRGCHKKGDVIAVMPDGHVWGAKEGPPLFVRVDVPGLDPATVRDRLDAWPWALDFAVVASDLSMDGFRLRATNTTESPSGGARITRAQIEAFLNSWGASVVSTAPGQVTFDVLIFDAATSVGFWGTSPAEISFAEDAYEQAGGVHTITVRYGAWPRYQIDPVQADAMVRRRIEAQGGTVVAQAGGDCTYQITRIAVRAEFLADVNERLGTYQRHRYHFSEADVDTVLANGGTITLTPAQVATAVLDRTQE